MVQEGKRLAELSRAVRRSSLKRLRAVPAGFEGWRPSPDAMSFADLAHHLAEADRWLFDKLENPHLPGMVGRRGEAPSADRPTYEALLAELERSGGERAALLEGLDEETLGCQIPDDRFGGEVTVWWVIVRGNLDHEAHHRGQIAAYLRLIGGQQEG